ncbi:MAG: hypothetical protein E7214_14950 [Clostridium sp.]|nr:hypothetical protein [Clostridium sp.]
MAFLTIGGVEVAAPTKFDVTLNDLDSEDSGRNKLTGKMARARIGTFAKIELEWNNLNKVQCTAILNAISSTFFTVSYVDPRRGRRSSIFYAGDISTESFNYDSTSDTVWYKTVKFNLIEQ